MNRLLFKIVLAIIFSVVLTLSFGGHTVANLGRGFWHGLISPVTLILSFFSSISVHEAKGCGWYNAGFGLGLAYTMTSLAWAGGFRVKTSVEE